MSSSPQCLIQFPITVGVEGLVLALEFDPTDPFPLLEEGEATYRDAQAHAALVDAWLGLGLVAIEERLSRERTGYVSARNEQYWIGLPIQTLQTPYTEFRFLLSLLNLRAGDHVVDLGAGYGRMGLVLARHFPEVSFTGYEVVHERVAEGRRVLAAWGCGSRAIELLQADLTAPGFILPEVGFYFLYDFGSRDAITKILNDLRAVAARRSIVVIARGRASRDAIERSEPWLSQVRVPEHFAHFSIYRS